MFINLTLGWCSIQSVFTVPFATIQNIACHRRLKRQFGALGASHLSADAVAIQSLPWESMIGLEDIDLGGKPVTLPSAIFGLTAIGIGLWAIFMAIVIVLSLTGPLEPPPAMPPLTPEQIHESVQRMSTERHYLYAALPVLVALFVSSLWWLHRNEHRSDGAPDLLAELFPLSAIHQTGRVHFVAFGVQLGQRYRIVVWLQNLFDTTTSVEASFAGIEGLPNMSCDVSATAVQLAYIDYQLPTLAQPAQLQVSTGVSTRGGNGSRIRHVQRQFLSSTSRKNTLDIATVIAGGGGSIQLSRKAPRAGINFVNGRGTLETLLLPLPPTSIELTEAPGRWNIVCIWEPRRPTQVTKIAGDLMRVLDGLPFLGLEVGAVGRWPSGTIKTNGA